MNNNRDELKFNELYQLLDEEANQIYTDYSDNIFNFDSTTNNQEIKKEVIFIDNENIFEAPVTVFNEPTAITINNDIISQSNVTTEVKEDDNISSLNKNEFRNITLIDKQEFDDGLDSMEDDKKRFIAILTSKKTLIIVSIITVIVVVAFIIKLLHLW